MKQCAAEKALDFSGRNRPPICARFLLGAICDQVRTVYNTRAGYASGCEVLVCYDSPAQHGVQYESPSFIRVRCISGRCIISTGLAGLQTAR
jgi:hypothetical protein